jgi:Ca2+-dependent lipid-binding protein
MSNTNISGTLLLSVVEAKLARDTEFIGKMDPFAVVQYKQQKFKTKVKDEAGDNPVWNE